MKKIKFYKFYYLTYIVSIVICYLFDCFIYWTLKNPFERFLKLPYLTPAAREEFFFISIFYSITVLTLAKILYEIYKERFEKQTHER